MDEENDTGVPPIFPVPEIGDEHRPKGDSPATKKRQRGYDRQKKLIKALENTTDPLKLKQIISAKSVADVYRTLDKLSIRREFHDALTRAGITFEFLIEGIKREALGGDKSADRLKAYEMLLKTLGLDKYDDVSSASTSSWEERLLKAINEHEGVLEEDVPSSVPETDYSVEIPQIPLSAKEKKKANDEMESSFFNEYPKP